MFWLVFWILVCVAILAYGIRRMANHDYRFGSGLFKSSDSNLDEKDEFVDKDYYDKKNLFKQYKAKSKALELFQEPFVVILRTKNAPVLYGSISYFIAFINL